MYWIVRGDIAAERAPDVKTILGPPIDFKRALLLMPNVGEDSDFERKPDQPRTHAEWGIEQSRWPRRAEDVRHASPYPLAMPA